MLVKPIEQTYFEMERRGIYLARLWVAIWEK
jgi:hypothetical protein